MRRLLLVAAAALLAAGCARPPAGGRGPGGGPAGAPTTAPAPRPTPGPRPARQARHAPSAEEVVVAFRQAGLPVAGYTVYTAETDEQHLLGRSGQYVSKATFADRRLVGDGGERTGLDTGGAVEVFADAAAATRRARRLAGGGRLYRNGAVLLRLDARLGRGAAARYQAVLDGLVR